MIGRVAVVGGGIAGLAASYQLMRAGVRTVVVYEREPAVFTHSSGRNAAIFRPLDIDGAVSSLVARSGELLDELMGMRSRWLYAMPLLLLAEQARTLEPLLATAESLAVEVSVLESEQLLWRAPLLKGGAVKYALEIPGAGVLNTHAIAMQLSCALRALGGVLRVRSRVVRVEQTNGRVTSVALSNGEMQVYDAVVVASGAWSNELSATAGTRLPLTPFRRHLALLDDVAPPSMPILWDIERELYFRAESAAILASPGDAEEVDALSYATDPRALEVLYDKALRVAPRIAGAGVRRLWACFRTLAPDGLPVIGEDAKVRGLYWLAGLGGFGMSAGLAAGEVLARTLLDRARPRDALFSPRRFAPQRGRP